MIDESVRKKLEYLAGLASKHQVWCPRCGPGKPTCPTLGKLFQDEERIYRIVSGVPGEK